jgi:hypothetical protein
MPNILLKLIVRFFLNGLLLFQRSEAIGNRFIPWIYSLQEIYWNSEYSGDDKCQWKLLFRHFLKNGSIKNLNKVSIKLKKQKHLLAHAVQLKHCRGCNPPVTSREEPLRRRRWAAHDRLLTSSSRTSNMLKVANPLSPKPYFQKNAYLHFYSCPYNETSFNLNMNIFSNAISYTQYFLFYHPFPFNEPQRD